MNEREKGLKLLSYYTNLPFSKPEMVNLGLTHRCNFKCSICNTREENPNIDEEMNLKEIKQVITSLGEWGNIGISFAGGEPLVKKEELIKSIKHAKKYDLTTYMTTNGGLIDSETAKSLVKSGIDFISVSLDGINEETNDYIRSPGSYKGVISAIENLKDWKKDLDSNVKVGITTVVTDKNLDELEEIHEFILEENLYEVNYNPYVPDNSFMGKVNYEEDEFWISEDRISELKSITDKLIEIKKSERGRVGTSEFILKNMADYFKQKENFSKGKCLAGQAYMYIKPNGEVDVCGKGPSFNKRPMNVKDKDIKKIWRDINFFITRLKIKNCKRPCLMLCFPKVSVKNFIKDVVK